MKAEIDLTGAGSDGWGGSHGSSAKQLGWVGSYYGSFAKQSVGGASYYGSFAKQSVGGGLH